MGPGAPGHDLGHQGDPGGKLSAHSQSGEEPVEGEVDPAHRQGGEPGEGGVDQDGQQHGLGASPAVAHDAEDEPSGGPSQHEDGRRHPAVPGDFAGRGPRRQQLLQRRPPWPAQRCAGPWCRRATPGRPRSEPTSGSGSFPGTRVPTDLGCSCRAHPGCRSKVRSSLRRGSPPPTVSARCYPCSAGSTVPSCIQRFSRGTSRKQTTADPMAVRAMLPNTSP